MKLKIKLGPNGVLPQKAHPSDAGFDLTATSCRIDRSTKFVEYGTDLSIELPEGHMGLIFPRSSISKYDMTLCNSVGLVDQNFRGELKLRFRSTGPHHYKVGDRIGQLVVMPIPEVELEVVDDLDDTDRSSGSFGSSGE